MHKMGGLWKYMPMTAICFLIASLAMSGLPLLNGAVSKAAIHEATTEASSLWWGYEWYGYAQYLGSILTFACLIHAFYVIFLGKPKPGFEKISDPPLYMLLPILILAALCIILGLCPWLLEDFLRFAAGSLLGSGA
jgi:formate hydrogenlyase subunit 3/multisubunit Na+/H+ antiporter MnhD subunit